MSRVCIFDNGTTTFTGSYSELRDKPANSSVGTWSTLAENPEWTAKMSYSNIEPLMYPATSTNLAVVVSDSITPMFTRTYNIGQDQLRWKHIFSDNVVCETIWFSQPGSYTTGIDLTAERIIYNEERIDLYSVDCELLKANAPLYALKTVINSIASDFTTLKTDVAKLKTDYAALLSIVNKLSMAPTTTNTTFWNSLRRERSEVYDYSSDSIYMYFIPTAYIVGDNFPTKITLSGVDYYMSRLMD
jgi:hypothetical protein